MNLLLDTAEKHSNGNELIKTTIVKELLHYDILDALNKSDISKELVFQGGTCLRLCYDAVRYSEDLDFCLKNKGYFSRELMNEFDRIFVQTIKRKYGLDAEVEYKEKGYGIKDDKSVSVEKWIARIFLKSKSIKQPKINIEVANVPSHDNEISLVKNRYHASAAPIPVQSESLREIFSDKIIALAARCFFKARDYWDIYYLKNMHIKPDISLVKKKIDDYSVENFDEKLNTVISSLFNENYELFTQNFKIEMKRFLTDEIYSYAKEQDFIDSVFKAVQYSVETMRFEEEQPHIIRRKR